MDIFQNQCSESLGFDSMLSSNHLNSPLHDSPGSPNALTFAPSSPYFSSISQQLCGSGTTGPNDVILPSIFVKIPTQINQQYQQENRLRNARTSNEIKCEDRAEPIKSEVADMRVKLATANNPEQLPDVIDNYLNNARGANGVVDESSIVRCDYCPFATLSDASLGEHKRTKHITGVRVCLNAFECPVCENKFFKKSVLELHLLEDHEMIRNEVELLCNRIASFQPNQDCGQSNVELSVTQTSGIATLTNSPIAPTNKSRIYIKNVQLLKKPDVIAQETENEHIQQGQGQQLLSVEQEPQSSSSHLCTQEDQLSSTEPSAHDQFPETEDTRQLQSSQQNALNSGNASKIFIRNVSLLQNVNFTPSAENILASNGGKYHSYMNLDCQSSLSPPIDTASTDDSYNQMLPSSMATQQSNRIFIKNVDILRNPLLLMGTTPGGSSSFNVTTSSRASSCDSIICTTTPPPSQPAPSQTLPPVQPTATIIPLTQIPPSQTTLSQTSQSMPGESSNGSIRLANEGVEMGLGGLASPQKQPPPIGQGMMFSATHESTALVDSCASPTSSVSSCISFVPVDSPSMITNTSGNSYQLPTFSSNGQQQQQELRKSKIFIKNISVLKQPTIHLKSVDEVNLMTYDQLQMQNLIPVGVGSLDGNMNIDSLNTHLDAERREELESGSQSTVNGQMDECFGNIMDVDISHQQPQQQQQQQDDAMDGYHDTACYGDLEVCDFTDGFNERDDPGGGEEGAISVASGGSNNNTLSINCDGILGEAHCDNFQSGFDQNIIVLQANPGVEAQANEKMCENWASVTSLSQEHGSSVSQDIFVSSEGVTVEGDMSAQYAGYSEERGKNILFICAQEVINLDPPNDEPEVGEVVHRAEGSTEGEQPPEQTVVRSDVVLPSDDSFLQQTTLPDDRGSERPRARGRPKGAKQTGITKLKKLYTNLTPQEEGYKCDIRDCGSRFRQSERLEYHRKCHLPVEQIAGGEPAAAIPIAIRCPECGSQEFRNWNTLHTHLWREHGIDMELYSCHLCAFKTPVLCRLTNTHMKIHSEERNFKCVICEKAFKNNKQLRNHRRSHREPTQTQQQQQDLPPASDVQVLSTVPMQVDSTVLEIATKATPKANATPLPIKCVKCGQKFTSQRQLHSHMNSKHPAVEDGQPSQGAGKHRCVLCGMMFKTRYLLQSHSAKHSDEKRFKCEHCDYTTNDHNAFRRHKMRHNTKGSHMYKCSYCAYTSIQSTTYRKHLERMHADVASTLLYKCDKCPFVSISELKYQLHKTKHENPGHADDDGEDDDDEARHQRSQPRVEDNGRPWGDMKTSQEQMPIEGNNFSTTNGDNQPGLHPRQEQQEDDSRACESVNSDVMIVDNRGPPNDPVGLELSDAHVHTQHRDESGMHIVQQPIIRPAMFANNFSKVDNFYGHQQQQQQQQQLQPKILKLTDRIPAHRVSPLGQLQFQSQTLQPSLVDTAAALPNVVPVSSGASPQDLPQLCFQMGSYEIQQQQQYEHAPTLTVPCDRSEYGMVELVPK